MTTEKKLTGKWTCNDGGTYCISQVNFDESTNIFWYGKANVQPGFTNVFEGTFNQARDTIGGLWADVPGGTNDGHGELTLSVNAEWTELRATNQTGGFSGTHWTKE